ncbi:putative RNA-directed DNA polymerase from transposon BS [Blattella germanica]|nr:putative RNA-directed DNA polymerase from transposon BS [Blattella germanica]
MIKNLPTVAKDILCKSYKYIFETGEIPQQWNSFNIIPILKPNKTPEDPLNYRPIALSSVIRKIYEKVITHRLHHYLERENIWPKLQYGFRPGYSTYDNLSITTVDILLAILNNGYLEATFIDINRAFDSVDINILKQDLSKYNINGKILHSIMKLITDRQITIKYNQQITKPRITSNGLPQGSSLSPILYIIYTKQLENEIIPCARILQFADDIVIYKTHYEHIQDTHPLQESIEKCKNWLESRNLTININKTATIRFTRKKQQMFIPPLKIENNRIKQVNNRKFLGLNFDCRLNWKYHIKIFKLK